MPSLVPSRWTSERIESDRVRALGHFVATWGGQGTRDYAVKLSEFSEVVRALFRATKDLRDLSGDTFTQYPALLQAARFVTAPPVSADDLKTLIGGNLSTRQPDARRAAEAARIVRSAWDPVRFPWLAANREPTDQERAAAIPWTASIWAIEAMRTARRNASSKAEERKTSEALIAAGFGEADRRPIQSLDDLPRGVFAGESMVGAHRCDRPVRLHDGRLLAIECKVSNSTINSRKRLNGDCGAKAADWRRQFGEQVIPAAVLEGVYSLGNLHEAQDRQGITLFWAHDLQPLTDFVTSAV